MNSLEPRHKYLLGMAFWMSLYCGLLFLSINMIRDTHPAGLMLYGLAVMPAIPIAATFWLVTRYMDKSDEYVRAIMAKRIIISTGITLSAATAYGFLEGNAGAPSIEMFYVYVFFWMCFGFISAFIRKAS